MSVNWNSANINRKSAIAKRFPQGIPTQPTYQDLIDAITEFETTGEMTLVLRRAAELHEYQALLRLQ